MTTDFLLCNIPISWQVEELPLRNRPWISKQHAGWFGVGHGQEADFPNLEQLELYAGDAGFQRVFYAQEGNTLLVSSSLKWMTQALHVLGFPPALDESGAYCLLSFGFMLEDLTLVKGVKKLRAGEALQLSDVGWNIYRRVDYRKVEPKIQATNHWIDQLHAAFNKSVCTLLEQSKTHEPIRATLSGGLDSRLVVHVLKEHARVEAAGVGQANYLDEAYARQYSELFGVDYFYHTLENGRYLLDVATPIALNEGLVFYNGAAHMMPLYAKWPGQGPLWSGLLGDAILGSYHTVPQRVAANPRAGAVSNKLVDQALEAMPQLAQRYPDEFTYKLYNRGFNGINNGAWSAEPFGGMVSPFMTKTFMELALAIPAEQKFGQGLYLQWLWTKYPEMMQVGWEAIGGVPSSPTQVNWLRKKRRLELLVAYKLLKDDRRVSMLPYLWWYRRDAELKSSLKTRFEEEINVLQGSLKKDAETLFMNGNLTEKAMVLSLLEAVKYLNISC